MSTEKYRKGVIVVGGRNPDASGHLGEVTEVMEMTDDMGYEPELGPYSKPDILTGLFALAVAYRNRRRGLSTSIEFYDSEARRASIVGSYLKSVDIDTVRVSQISSRSDN